MAPGEYAFLFTDLAGSTQLWEAHPAAMEIALAEHDAILRGAVEENGGDLFSTMGDGIAAAFETAGDAVAAAVAAQRGLTAQSWGETGELRIRIGIHIGVAQRRGDDYFGPTVNRCARLMAVGHGGQVLLSGAARERLEPACELRDLGMHRLRDLAAPEHVFQLASAGLDIEFPPLLSLDFRPGNLPLQATTFVGRHEDVAAAISAMDAARIVTFTGVGGVGKTRLALQLAAEVLPRFVDGAWICELATIGDPAAVPHTVASLFGVHTEAGGSVTDALVTRLGESRALLVLDNCEHVLDAVGELVENLVSACAGVVVLATSREPLAVAGEVIRPVRALGGAAAVQLFVERAVAVRSDFTLTPANEQAVAEICRRLDGVPLGLELAAARVTSMSPSEIAQRLDERFRLLTGGRRTAVERQRTLRGAVDWSFELLDPVEQRVYSRLAVFAGGFTLAAAEAVAAEPGDVDGVVDVLWSLVRKSMVVVEPSDDVTRYSLLETLRQYAEEQLVSLGEGDATRSRHGDYLAMLAEESREGERGPDEAAWVLRVDAEVDNFRAALSWAIDHDEQETAARLVAALGSHAYMHMWSEFDSWARTTTDLLGSSPGRIADPLGALTYAWAAHHAWNAGDTDRARELADQCLGLSDVHDDGQAELFIAHSSPGLVTGDPEGPIAAAERGVETYRRWGVPSMVARSLAFFALALAATNQADRAREVSETALASARLTGNPTAIGICAYALGESLLDTDADLAVASLQEAERALASVNNTFGLGITRLSLLSALGRSSDALRAAEGYLELLEHWEAAGNRQQQWATLRNAAELLSRCDQLEVTAAVHGAMRKRGSEPTEGSPEWLRLSASLASAQIALGDGYGTAVEQGVGLSDDELVTLVRDALHRTLPV